MYLINNYIVHKDNLYKNLILLNKKHKDVNIVFGDSHAAFDYAVPSGYLNLAFPSENILDIKKRAQLFLNRNNCGKVILSADPHFFSSYRVSESEKDYLTEDINSVFISDYHKSKLLLYWELLLSGAINSGVIMGEANIKQNIKFHSSGWQEFNKDFSLVDNTLIKVISEKRFVRHTPLDVSEIKPLFDHYSDLVLTLTSNSCDVCLVTSPVSKVYFDLAINNERFKSVFDFFVDIASKYKVRYVNNFGMFSDEASMSLFSDEDHLNSIGAYQFTHRTIEMCY